MKERIRIEFLDIVYAGFHPFSGEEHHGAHHGGDSGGVAHCLHACLAVGRFVAAVVVYVVCERIAVLVFAGYAAADGCLSVVVFAKVLRIGQYGFEELEGNDLGVPL